MISSRMIYHFSLLKLPVDHVTRQSGSVESMSFHRSHFPDLYLATAIQDQLHR